jgi:hypothetical protein
MPSEYILGLISRMQVQPTPLFRGDVDSGDSVGTHDDDTAVVDETMATQGPEASGEDPQGAEASGENQNLVPSIGLLDPEGYVDMRAPWVEGAKGEKVCLGNCVSGSTLIVCSAFACRWCITPTLGRGS